ncbi:hypothetical protein B7P43_G13989 [Cryptotermes secundus]|uniref:Uncharacterized protein n=1 Tax=Cryptotermes secundus TaxID=105785 RepID=A0A2J7PWS1_9NEOP|nr:hypothetical protein B7P43_G13989 [Cryptotermes secundus]
MCDAIQSDVCQHFGEIYFLHLQAQKVSQAVNQQEAGGKQNTHEDGGNAFLLFATGCLFIALLGLLVDPENVVPSPETSVNF